MKEELETTGDKAATTLSSIMVALRPASSFKGYAKEEPERATVMEGRIVLVLLLALSGASFVGS